MGFEVAYDPGENIKIVKTVEKYPVLYNTKKYPPLEYRGATDRAWTKVAAELGASEGYCKGRWTNIRGCFKRYLKNKARSSNTKAYYMAEYLKFLLPFMHIRQNLELEQILYNQNFGEEKNYDGSNDIKVEPVSDEFEVNLVDSDGEEESFFISTNDSEETTVSEAEKNADWDFFSSLLPDVQKMDDEQKSKFRNGLLTAIDMVLYGEDL